MLIVMNDASNGRLIIKPEQDITEEDLTNMTITVIGRLVESSANDGTALPYPLHGRKRFHIPVDKILMIVDDVTD